MEGLRKIIESWFRLGKFDINKITFAGRRITDFPSLTEEFVAFRSAVESFDPRHPQQPAGFHLDVQQVRSGCTVSERHDSVLTFHLCQPSGHMAHGFTSKTFAFDDGRSWARRGHACRDGQRNAHIPEDESQSDLVAKRQAQEEGVKHACTRDLFLSQEAAGDVQRQHGRRRGGARQAQYAVPVRRTGSMGPSIGTGDISKPHRRHEVFVPRGAPKVQRAHDKSGGAQSRWRSWPTLSVRWEPRPQMPADGLTNAELATTKRCGGVRDQDWSPHSTAETSKDETAVRTTTSQTLTAIRCRADSQRVLPKKERTPLTTHWRTQPTRWWQWSVLGKLAP